MPEILCRLGSFVLMAKDAVLGIMSGLHKSISKGSGGDFVQYSPCSPGDDLRYVDWKLYARQDRLYNKVLRDDTVMQCAIVLDCTGSMAYRGKSSPMSKFQYAAILGACFACVAASQNDNIAVFTYGGAGLVRIPFERQDSVLGLVDELDMIKPSGNANLENALRQLDDFLGHSRGMTVFISDFIDFDMPSLLRHFYANSRDLRLCHIMDRDELEIPFSGMHKFEDAETGEDILVAPELARDAYREKVENWLQKVREDALEWQAQYQFATSDASFLDFFC